MGAFPREFFHSRLISPCVLETTSLDIGKLLLHLTVPRALCPRKFFIYRELTRPDYARRFAPTPAGIRRQEHPRSFVPPRPAPPDAAGDRQRFALPPMSRAHARDMGSPFGAGRRPRGGCAAPRTPRLRRGSGSTSSGNAPGACPERSGLTQNLSPSRRLHPHCPRSPDSPLCAASQAQKCPPCHRLSHNSAPQRRIP